MKVLIFLYDDYAEFEISILDTVLKGNGVKVITCSHQKKPFVVSSGGLQVVPHLHIDEVAPQEYAALIIPGGNPYVLLEDNKIMRLIKEFHHSNIYIAAICAGPSLLASAGILNETSYTTSLTPAETDYSKAGFVWENKVNRIVMTDKNVTTATGSAYVEFAEEVLKSLGLVPPEEENTLAYFKVPGMS